MKISNINCNDVHSNLYIYEDTKAEIYLIALPELNWSLEIDTTLNEDDINDELVIHLFTLLDESTATKIGTDIVRLILED
ncbi:MAG: YueH family protein [Staphylococcus equorum]|uniref:YueH family protein n=1 Tax=Staphylococcus TaxID=1279 RepID=UPI000853AF55|nr:YueH family protein [Staphylococcus equorum]MDG0821553.1 YueH family protein [Staphylococcus equorum]MDG0837602.1 YueH family protein [Staphylococcus equorum]MDK9876728.1 YueH family protein [Staphylococcus equorum]MDN5809056.1 YueH family protein [Staphylococcus equorum]MDN5829167.1 YueH family protein [Staphylococcus equorum]